MASRKTEPELSRKVVLGAKRTELPKNGLGNTDEKVFTVCGFEGTNFIFLDSSMVEHSAVNRGVVGSSPTRGVFS